MDVPSQAGCWGIAVVGGLETAVLLDHRRGKKQRSVAGQGEARSRWQGGRLVPRCKAGSAQGVFRQDSSAHG
eukprot:scaffold7099_cov281-Pinguiococcus_pyrenoidosus.AAC.27